MDPLNIMKSILKVAQGIAKAARTARRNKSRCLELADRVRTVGNILHNSNTASDTARGRALGRLKDALADALKLVESCSRRSCWFSRLLASGRQADRFHDVETRINSCVADLGIANDARLEKLVNELAARDHPRTNAKARSTEKENNHNAKKKDVAMNDNKSTTAAAAGYGSKKRRRARRKGNKQMKEKAAEAGPTPPRIGAAGYYAPIYQDTGAPFYQHYGVRSAEEDPNSCSVM